MGRKYSHLINEKDTEKLMEKLEIHDDDKIKEAVEKFIGKETGKGEYCFTRYRSWTRCHDYFLSIKEKKYEDLNEDEKSRAQLELGYYLASWGMYRGSSFILQYDCSIFEKIIPIILNKKYSYLWDLSLKKINSKGKLEIKNLLVKIREEINDELKAYRDYYNQNKNELPADEKNDEQDKHISQTLVTKILLGTLCCIPAYDTYFCNAIRSKEITKGKFNDFYDDDKIMNLLNLISNPKNQIFEDLSKKHKYPLMKIVDMAYFTIGYDQALAEKSNKKEKIKNEQ